MISNRLLVLIEESEWYGLLREELAIEDGFFGYLRAFARVGGRYALRLIVFALAVAALTYLLVHHGSGGGAGE